jgi:glucuronoarabinoxylan endo-1,4-beta-xylanase
MVSRRFHLVAIPLLCGFLGCGTDHVTSGGTGGNGKAGAGGAAGQVGSSGTGGATGSGGVSGRGGAASAGGTTGLGGATGRGGSPGTGGATGTGGVTGSGGSPRTGGASGVGGVTGSGGSPGTGGTTGVGGVTGGGSLGTGGTIGLGGATGGALGTGGMSGNRDAGSGGLASGGGTAGMAGAGGSPTGGSKATGGTTSINTTPAPCTSGAACVDFTVVQQEIDGLGAAAPGSDILSTAVLDAAFKNDTLKQMGLSILRVEIDPAGQSGWDPPKTNGTNAKSRGVKYVMATPWSPPSSMKSNNNAVEGELKTASYADYAAFLKSFYAYMGGAGGAVDIISVQNEPNVVVTYLSATWSATQLLNFTKNNAQAIGAPYMMPETYNYDTSYSDPTLNDATAAANVSYIGLHLYGAQIKPYTLAVQKQKKIWMTEHFFDPEDIGTMMSMAKEIMDCFNSQMNGYVWWYLVTPNCNLVTSSGTLANKGYVMGQFSKYIRPGAHRVSATYQPQNNVNVQAYAGTPNVIVALNRGTSAVSQNFAITGGSFTSLHKYTTSNSKKLSDDGTVAVTSNAFTASLDAQSVTTFVAAP